MLYIDKIFETLPYGKTKPIKVKASDGNVYVVKFRKDGLAGTDRCITNEFIAYKLLEKLGWSIAPLKLELIQIDELSLELANGAALDIKSVAYMRGSLGTNIAIPFVDNCEKAEGTLDNLAFISQLRVIDNIMLNCDRSVDNPNILKDLTAKYKYYAIDWGLAMDNTEVYRDIKSGSIDKRMMYFDTINILKRPYYLLKPYDAKASWKTQKIEDIIHEIIEDIPAEWETYKDRAILADILCARATSKKIFE